MRSKIPKRGGGFTLVEAMVSTIILGMIVASGLSLYLKQQKQWLIQEQIADMQQNVRVSMAELSVNTRMAACGNFPWGLEPIESVDSNPDTLILRRNPRDCGAVVGKNIHSNTVHTRDDPACFLPGSRVFIWDYIGQSEWFTVDRVDTNEGLGWYEIHAVENLVNVYQKKDNPRAMVMTEMKYHIDQTADADHPSLMRSIDGLPAQVFAENVEDLQVVYIMKNGSTTAQPDSLENVRALEIEIRARTDRQDPKWTDQDHGDGYRRRALVSQVDARNLGL
jgi:hypothetical protein